MSAQAVSSCLAATLILVVLSALLSFGSVRQNEYGLVFNWITKEVSPKVYHGGRHLIGFWNAFVLFPATVQTVEFSNRVGKRNEAPLHTRTKEGLALHLSIAFQYRLLPDRIPELYTLTNAYYDGLYRRIARDKLLEAASEYEGPQYWMERGKIANMMRKKVNDKLQGSYATLWNLELMDIDLPDVYEASITQTQVQEQLVDTRKSQQNAASIRADTSILRAEFERNISVVRASSQANYTLAWKNATAEAQARKLMAEAEALQYTRKNLHFSAADAVAFSQFSSYGQMENATFLANFNSFIPMVQPATVGTAAEPNAAALTSATVDEAPSDARRRRRAPKKRSSTTDDETDLLSTSAELTRKLQKSKVARGQSHRTSSFLPRGGF